MESCKTLVVSVDNHFRDLTKMIALVKGSQCEVHDALQQANERINRLGIVPLCL